MGQVYDHKTQPLRRPDDRRPVSAQEGGGAAAPARKNGGGKKGKGPDKKAARSLMLRCVALVMAFLAAGALLGMRLGTLQIDEASEWEARASNQQLASVPITPTRGNIYDANMKVMAQSATVWTVEASPDQLVQSRVSKDSEERDAARIAAREFAKILGLDEAELYANLSDKEKKYYKVKSKIEKPEADLIREMKETYNLNGIYLTEDTKRYYPYEELGSTVLGFVGGDNNGLEGLERQYEEVLAGTPGRTVRVRDAFGNEITAGAAEEGTTYAAEDGNSIVLTIDTEIQAAVEKHLKSAVEEHNARERGFAIVMDVNTGGILALAVYPSYNPNQPYDILDAATLEAMDLLPEGSEERSALSGEARTLQWRNKALADTYEPGSVLKVITAAAALDSGTYTQDNCFACSGSIMVPGWDLPMSCAGHPYPTAHGAPSLRTALIESCNVSFIQMSAGMGATTWYSYLKAFGLTEPTGIDLPGEPSQTAIDNLIYSLDRMGPVELASCSFGQSNKYTAVQMITAVSAAVNGGNLMQPYIVKAELDSAGNVVKNYEPEVKRQVISEETSAQICDILEELVTDTSNGKNAYVAGYRVGGKSGTSQKLEVMAATDREDAYVSSFVGFAPADDPEIAVLVVLDEPEDPKMGNYFGGRLAGPAVREIIRESMDILGIEPVYTTDAEIARSVVATPKCTDYEVAYAQKLLNEAGLSYRVMGEGGTVMGQVPAAYAQIPYGGEVVLYTDASVVPETIKMPDAAGRGASAAISMLKGLGFNVITTGAPEGEGVVVVEQSLAVDEVVNRGTVVTLTLEDQNKVAD